MNAASGNAQRQPVIMIVVGSIITGVSTLLLWMKLEAEDTETVEAKGLDLDMGAFALFAAIVVVVLAVVQYIKAEKGGGRGFAIANIVLCSLMLFASVYVVATPGDAFAAQAADQVAEQFNISEGLAEEAIKTGVDAGQVDVSAQLGAFIALAGSLIALIGSIVGTTKAKKRGAAAVPPGQAPLGSSGPGTPPAGGSTPTDPTGSSAPPPGTPPGGPTQPGA